MKKIKILGVIVTLITVFLSCEELPDPAGERGAGVVPGIENLNPAIFDSKSLSNTYIEFTLSLPAGASAQKITIVGSYNDNTEETVIAEIATFPSVVRILASDAAQKMGIALGDIANGDLFTFQLLPTIGDRTFHSSAVLAIPVACAYDVNLATGSYKAAVPGWSSYEWTVTLESDPDDPYTIYVTDLGSLDGCGEDNGPFVLHIDPVNYAVTAETKEITSDYYGFGAITYSGEGVYGSCNGSFTLYLDISVGDYGSQGVFEFDLTRN